MVDLDALELALSAATPGDWTWEQKSCMGLYRHDEYHELSAGCLMTECGMDADTEFIVLAHNLMAALIAELRQARDNLTSETDFVQLLGGLILSNTERENLVTLYRTEGWTVAVQKAYEMRRK